MHIVSESATIIYTDASKSKEGCACAFYDSTNEVKRSIRLSNYMSIFSAEAEAILMAVEYIREANIKKAYIMTDSKSTLQALLSKNFHKMHPTVHSIFCKSIDLKKQGITLQFFWIKGHVNITPNDIVDALAKNAVREGKESHAKVYWKDIIAVLKREILGLQWEQRWREINSIRSTQYFHVHPNVTSKSWHNNSNIPRAFYSTIARLKFGHGLFPAHLYKLQLISSPNCGCGNELADLNHLLLECVKHYHLRELMITELIKLKVLQPMNMVQLLRTNDIRVYRTIYNYIVNTGIKI